MNLVLVLLWGTLGVFFLGLMVFAFPHAKDTEKLTAISPYWCFFESIYDEEGKKLCKIGKYTYMFAIPLVLVTFYYG